MLKYFLFLYLFCFQSLLPAQDTTYARSVIKALTSKKCFGRGYINDGLNQGKRVILNELRKFQVTGFFKNNSFTESFQHPVNVFKQAIKLKLNGKQLVLGKDFIPSPNAPSVKGKIKLIKKDSVTFVSQDGKSFLLTVKNKLTYGVGLNHDNYAEIEIDKKAIESEPKEIEINLKAQLIKSFQSNNIGCRINGTSTSDSLIVFCAHYDHLGGIGKSVYFPGANDNASGVSFLLNLIKYYKANQPKYTTIFLFFAAEEAGLLGSNYFVENHKDVLPKIKFLINLDLLGTGDEGITVVNGAVFTNQFSKLQSINAKNNYLKEIKKRGKAQNSDHYWFTEMGVPSFFIYTLGGIKAYHDIYDVESTLPLTEFVDVFKLLTEFVNEL
ncbi:MAG: Zn-dependent exopeptidase M28 [Bacteroidetes bacterium]|nr:Zn-dependent exopeptidase M28 [Bacteroidota bacterium]